MYNTGTVTTTANSTKVTGTNTKWKDNNSLVSAEQVILIQNGTTVYINSIASIQSDTELTLSFAAPAAVKNGSYRILTTMVNSISDAANKLVAMNNANAVFSEVLNRMFTETGIITVVLPDGTTLKTKTFAEMDKQLEGKLDKAGGEIEGPLKIKNARVTVGGVNDFAGIALTRSDGSYLLLESRPTGNNALLGIIDRSELGSNGTVVNIPNRPGTVALAGDFGLGGTATQSSNWDDITMGGLYSAASQSQPELPMAVGGLVVLHIQVGSLYASQICFRSNKTSAFTWRRSRDTNGWGRWYASYGEENTTKDANGNLKAASPIIRVFADHIEPNDESEGVELEKLSTGRYKLKGTLGMHSDASWGGIHGGLVVPNGINNLPLVWADFDVLPDGDIVIETRYRKHALHPMLEAQRLMTYPEFLDENNEEREDYDYCDIPNGHWIDVRVNMPSNSLYNQKQAEAERLAKLEAERLAQEEAKRAAEEAERAEQEAAEQLEQQ